MNNKKRYAVGFYSKEERANSPEWIKGKGNRLVTFLYDNIDLFNVRYMCHDKEEERAWIILDTQELAKAKEYFEHKNDTEVLEWIDICLEYDKWKTNCSCCDSISINTIPYTYREYGGCIGRSYNCPMCSGLSNRIAGKVGETYRTNGVESAIDLIIEISEDRHIDEEEKYYCKCCERDLRVIGLIENGEYIISKNHEGKLNKLTIDEYNKQEELLENEIEGYYPNYYPVETVYKATEVNGYRCFECNNEIKEDVVKEILS